MEEFGQRVSRTLSQLSVTEASQAILKKQKSKLLKLPSKMLTAAFRRPSETPRSHSSQIFSKTETLKPPLLDSLPSLLAQQVIFQASASSEIICPF